MITELRHYTEKTLQQSLSFFNKAVQSGWVGKKNALSTVQVNIGLLCNQICRHCHVESSPKKIAENMDEKTISRIVYLLKKSNKVKTLDITGGAPELNPHFRFLVEQARKIGLEVIDRCNLTVLFEKGQESTAEFLADNSVRVVASLPCYLEDNVDRQRGDGVYEKSIEALKIFNNLGYGKKDTGLELDLVYNPIGPNLPPEQFILENSYKEFMIKTFNIRFNNLLTITNMPIKRFEWDLKRQGQLETYKNLLFNEFNEKTLSSLMCNSQVSVGWDGNLYDCDFNYALGMKHAAKSIWDIESFDDLVSTNILTDEHCYGCSAGSGSSCGGVLASK